MKLLTSALAFVLLIFVFTFYVAPSTTRARANQDPPPSDVTENPIDQAVIDQLKGEWENALHSAMKIEAIDPQTGVIRGSYRSGSGAGSAWFPLQGWVNTAAPDPKKPDSVVVVSFSVRWGQIGSVTAWNGYFRSIDTPVIVGQWLLSRPNSEFPWEHILAGQDQFTRSPQR